MTVHSKNRLFKGTLLSNKIKLNGIHGLRAVAAIMILFVHISGVIQLKFHTEQTKVASILSSFALTGVHLFFILSAFSLANSTTSKNENLVEYALKRFFRIAPLYYTMLVLQQLGELFLLNTTHSLTENLLNIAFLFNFTPKFATGIVFGGWTIGVEMIFYTLLPFILFACKSLRSVALLAATGVFISWITHKGMLESDPSNRQFASYASLSFITNVGAFSIGLLIFKLFQLFKGNQNVARISLLSASALLTLLILSPLMNNVDMPGRPAILILFGIYGLLCLSQAIRPSWLLSNPIMQYLGERSFSIYLVQLPILSMLATIYNPILNFSSGNSITSYFLFTLVSLPCVIFAANITYHLIEIPSINIGQKIIDSLHQ